MLKETNLEGLVPGMSYTIELASQDYCGNIGTSRKTVTMPALSVESNAPAVSTPTVVLVGFQTAVSKTLQFSATDDTGIKHLTVMINGTIVQAYDYSTGAAFRWWCNPYTLDSVQSTLEGPNFCGSQPATYAGPVTGRSGRRRLVRKSFDPERNARLVALSASRAAQCAIRRESCKWRIRNFLL